ncbi:MAG TPA: bi-domain-containing oxidoreductase [Anaerolineales bacterium]|nr:bi-domain-containing oxidoreductase [Anaerolineales bacterium]HNQ96296.1 bi-domain-containing oxidoreductase [Anaerolineales bacterium]HNS59915.1 bi-domain-containing oxidoreductase [Anaerolineales bacterium]
MKQLLQNIKTGKTTIEDVPAPTPREGQALVKVEASLVSAGTERMVVEFAEKSLVGKARSRPDLVKQVLDKARREGVVNTMQAAFNRLDQPMALGYSSAGTIVALGKNISGFKVGQRVACAGGGFAVHAEYNVVPRNLLTPLPKNVDFESAAFTTLGAIAMHGFRLAEPQLGENVAVIGLGLLGLLAIQIASAAGCNVLGIDLDPKRIALASSLGLQSASRQRAESTSQLFTANRGFDVVLICADTSSNDPVELAGIIARDRARVVATGAVGLNIPRKIYYEKEISFINSRSYGPGRYDSNYEENGQDYPLGYVRWTEGRNFQAVVDLMESRKLKVKPLITHRFPIEKATQAYDVITGKKKESFLGVLLTYPEGKRKEESRITFPTIVNRKSSIVNLGVLGAGLFANSVLLPSIKKVDGVQLVGIASSGGLHAQHAGKKFGFKYATSSDDEIINDPNVNAVAILTRHDSHAELVLKALKAGKHVFVEKPLAINSDQLSVISKQLQKTDNSLLMTGFNRRFAPLAISLKSLVSNLQSPFHTHYRINAGYLPPNHWTQDPNVGGGRIIGEACHFIDFITFLVGAAPVSVSAHALPDGGKYSEDNVSMTFTFPDGSIGVVDYLANGDKSFPKERAEVFCGGAVAVLDDFVSLQITREGKMKEERGAQDKGWVNEWKAFVKAIHEGGEPPIPYEQLIGVTKSTFAAVESLRTMQTVKL